KLFDNNLPQDEKKEIQSELKISQQEFDEKNWGLVIKQDSINLSKVSKIITIYGYPGKTLVGENTNKAAWYVIQHSNSIETYFPIIKQAGKEGEIPMTLVAMMEDRLLMEQNKEQIYGTQIRGEKVSDDKWLNFVWPIKDYQNVNIRREKVGFDNTIEEYVKSFDIEYKIYTLEDVKKIRSGEYSED